MKRIFTILSVFLFFAGSVLAQLSTGSIAFTGFNADGDDDLAFVTFEDIDTGTIVYFCDSEWDGTAFGTDEGDFAWYSGNTVISKGSIVILSALSSTTPSSNYGTLTGSTGLSSSGEAVFAFLGTAARTPTTFLAAIANGSTAFGDLSGTGMQTGTTAIVLTSGVDVAIYSGARSGFSASGYLSQLNNISNWTTQDGSGDQHNDGTSPDLPFNTTAFSFTSVDATAPQVTSVKATSDTTLLVYVSELIKDATATQIANFSFSPSITIASATYDNTSNTITLKHAGLSTGVATTITINNLEDTTGNKMTTAHTSAPFYYNATTPNLVISEIMYNIPVSFGDAVEFIEIINAGTTTIPLGGLKVRDAGNFAYTFPEMNLAAGAIVLLANEKAVADTFYNATFLDMSETTVNTLGNGGERLEISNTAGTVVFEVTYDDATPWPTSPDGGGTSLEIVSLTKNANDGANWVASSTFLKAAGGVQIFASPGTYTAVTTPTISFEKSYAVINESAGSITLKVKASEVKMPYPKISVSSLTGFSTAQAGTDYTFMDSTYEFNNTANATLDIVIPITNNTVSNDDKMFVLQLSNATNADFGGITQMVVYILDNEETAPNGLNTLGMEHLHSFVVDAAGTAEIVAFDSASKRLFVLNSAATAVDIFDFNNPTDVVKIKRLDMSAYGIGATSVSTYNGLVAATVDNGPLADGAVVLLNTDGTELKKLTVGNLPDMVTFTPDGKYILTANEGQPSVGYTADPEGSISMIDISKGAANTTQADVTTLTFNAFDAQKQSLKDAGVRIFGLNATVSQDMEPEYITVSADSKTAWVTLQENNAVAAIDLVGKSITKIIPLGTKDHSLAGNGLDASDRSDSVIFINWNVKGMYMPDAMANYTVNGTTYLVTANEGDQREYDVIDEDVTVNNAAYVLDATKFPNASLLKKDQLLGRLAVSPYSGDTDNDGDFDEIHAFGARSFSIWNANTGALVYDSKDDFEKITANDPIYKSLFNASNSNNNFKNRSDNKGPEPEGVTVATIANKVYAFVTLERTGGIMTYDITNPQAPVFENYINNRTLGPDDGGDLAPEGIIYISPAASPIDTGLVLVANEVSSTIGVYKLATDKKLVSVRDVKVSNSTLKIYPNPASEIIYFSRPTAYKIYNTTGVLVLENEISAMVNISLLPSGMYYVLAEDGSKQSFIKQ